MEKTLKPYDREHMKMAMLKHEETFKKQIYELHRLYRVQKILMKGVENNKSNRLNQTNDNSRNFYKKPRPEINLDQLVARYSKDVNGDEVLDIEDESDIRLTLGPTKYNLRKKTETSDSGTSFSSSSTGSSHIINGANQGPHQNQENYAWGVTMVTADSNPGYQNAMKRAGYDQSSRVRLNQPSRRVQALSLNMS